MPTIAVIVSIYKNDQLIHVREAIQSILFQTCDCIKLYVLLDGPVECAVEKYLCSLTTDRLMLFRRDDNKGLAVSLNELLNIVLKKDYQYIARMDADDISLPERLQKQIEYMEYHKDIDCLGTWALEIDSLGNEYFWKKMPVTHEECLELFRIRDCMIHPTVMFRRSYFEKAGLYPEDTYFGEDTMMWARGFKTGCRFANLPEFLFKFRLDENFFKRRRGWKHAKSIFQLRRKVNKMLGFGWKEDCYAFLYAAIKMMPEKLLNIFYKIAR